MISFLFFSGPSLIVAIPLLAGPFLLLLRLHAVLLLTSSRSSPSFIVDVRICLTFVYYVLYVASFNSLLLLALFLLLLVFFPLLLLVILLFLLLSDASAPQPSSSSFFSPSSDD